MDITPNSTIKLYHNVPLNNTYTDTFYFSSKTQQDIYFHNGVSVGDILKYTLTAQSYQRVNKGKMRVQIPNLPTGIKSSADALYDCNYLAFKNTAFNDKWFYAFITSVEYISELVAEVSYEIDVMQTYMFNVTLKPCFIERQHSQTDVAGDNVLAEPIDGGTGVCVSIRKVGDTNYHAVMARANKVPQMVKSMVGGLFTGVQYIGYSLSDQSGLDTLNAQLSLMLDYNQTDEVVSLFLIPSEFYTEDPLPEHYSTTEERPETFGTENDNEPYTPRNKKLLTYPYNYLEVDTDETQKTYRYEYFNNPAQCNFERIGTIACNPEIALVPLKYNGTQGITGGYLDELNWSEKVVMGGFPQIAFCIDAYRAWLAQNTSTSILQGVTSGVSLIGGLAALMTGVGAPIGVGGIAAGASGLANLANKMHLASIEPDDIKGNPSGNISVASRQKVFLFKRMQIRKEIAKCIDDFFDMYGYAMNKVGKPQRHVRTYWTYTKTRGCVIVGSCPADDIKKMCTIYDNGIRFWAGDGGKTQYFGRYDLSNDILST